MGEHDLNLKVTADEYASIVVHQAKEHVIQRVLRGSVVATLTGDMQGIPPTRGVNKKAYSMLVLDAACSQALNKVSVKHHLCWIVHTSKPFNRITDFLFEEPERNMASRNSVVSSGRFQLSLRWEGTGQQFLRFHGSVPAGNVQVLVGEYAGIEHYCVAAL